MTIPITDNVSYDVTGPPRSSKNSSVSWRLDLLKIEPPVKDETRTGTLRFRTELRTTFVEGGVS